MILKIRRTTQVRRDIIEIYGYVHDRSPQGAERVLNAIEHSIKNLPNIPGAGTRWEAPDPALQGMRVVVVTPYRNYLIFFRPTTDAIEVFRVVHGGRELEKIVDEIQIEFEPE